MTVGLIFGDALSFLEVDRQRLLTVRHHGELDTVFNWEQLIYAPIAQATLGLPAEEDVLSDVIPSNIVSRQVQHHGLVL